MGAGTPQQRLTRGLIAMLAAVGALGSMAIHMFVPAMPLVAADLGAAPDVIQLAVTLYLIGLGVGQLAAGPASDRIGRRPVLLAGLALFVAGAAACGFATDALVMLAARVVQAAGGAAAIVTARAIVSDLAESQDVAARLATLMSVLLISPAVSPLIGGAIAALGGWRAIFAVLAAAGFLAALASIFLIGETGGRNSAGSRFSLAQSYAQLTRNRRFLRYAGAIACSSCALYIFLSGSAFLLIDRYGLGAEEAGLCYFLIAVAGIGGTFLVGTLERRRGAFRIGLGCICGGGAAMLMLALAGSHGPVALIAPMMLAGVGAGIAAPAGMAGAMRAEEGLGGTAASLAGALQMLVSGVATSLVVQMHPDTLAGLAAGIFLSGLLGLLISPKGRAV